MQEVLQKNSELEFIVCPSKKLECLRCHRKLNTNCFIFNRVLKTDVCHQCNKSIGSNPFYNPKYGKRNNYVGVKNMSEEEISLLINKLIRQGISPYQAKNRVFNDLRIIRHQKITKIIQECPNLHLDIKIEKKSGLNKVLVEGLGMKRR